MFQIADLLAIVAGAIAGAIAFLPFVFTLKPVLDDKQNADMLKGMVSLAVSAIALLVFTLVVFVLFGLPGYVYISMVTGTGNTRLAFIFQVVTIIVYLGYLYVLSCCFTMPLAVYLTAEYVFVILLGVQSYVYLKRYVGSTGRPHGNKSKLETTK